MDAGVPVESVLKQLFLNRLPRATQKAFLKCLEFDFLSKNDWYLAGGTALALQVGHRQSVDLDFFTPQSQFPETFLERILLTTGHWQTTYRERGTLYGVLMKAKMSFIAYPFFKPSGQWLYCSALRILQPPDIAVMKVIAVSQRGRKRDFVDLYWYCLNHSLKEAILKTLKQYSGQQENLPHILKSLTYFEDADADPMPSLYFKATWRQIKMYFRREVPKISKILLEIR